MSEIVPTDENTLNVELVVEPTTSSSPPVDTTGVADFGNVSELDLSVPDYGEYKISQLKSSTPTIPKVAYTLGKTVLSLDVETTGLNPWDYKMIVCTVWDLNDPKNEMKTFSGWDEELLVKELFEYIESKNPNVILAFNAKFECRCFVTRAMLYHIRAPWIWSVEWHDMMTMLEGGWKNGLSGTMPSGSEENWLNFFFNETKPYTIDECFEGIRNGSLKEMEIRNRTCVQGQGDMYRLFMYCQSSEDGKIPETKPSAMRIKEASESGIVLEKCDVCGAPNEVSDLQNPGQCWRCFARLSLPTSQNIIKEVTRDIDWSKVGLSGSNSGSSKASSSKTSATAKK